MIIRNGDQINVQFWLVFFATVCVENTRRNPAMPAFFALTVTKNPNPNFIHLFNHHS